MKKERAEPTTPVRNSKPTSLLHLSPSHVFLHRASVILLLHWLVRLGLRAHSPLLSLLLRGAVIRCLGDVAASSGLAVCRNKAGSLERLSILDGWLG